MGSTRNNFSKNLEYWLNARGMSQARLAEEINVSAQTITNYVRGANLPRMNRVDDICRVLGISRTDLVDERSIKKDRIIFKNSDFELRSNNRILKRGAREFLSSSLYSMTESIRPSRKEILTWLSENFQTAALSGANYESMNDDDLYDYYKEARELVNRE